MEYLKPDAFFHAYAVEDGQEGRGIFDLENDLEETTNLAQRTLKRWQNSKV